VFFKLADRFRAQARSWTPERLATALDLLTEAELGAKSTGQPDRLICQRVLMQIATAARARVRN
jgi:DNA polymerase-3 subunit delta